ncbi:MAG: signal peptidase I [Ruminococcus sp.]
MKFNSQKITDAPTAEQLSAELSREKYRKRFGKVLRNTVYILTIVAAVAVLVSTIWMPVLQVYSTSMTPTLNEGDILISVKGSNFQQGDLVAFYIGNKILVKRCIAGPGQTVDIDKKGNVYVDDAPLDEPYVSKKALGDCDIELPYKVPDNQYFFMGDNRASSVDSRYSSVGSITEDQIIGKVLLRVWPLSGFGVPG